MTVPAWPVRRVLLALVVACSVSACSSEPSSQPEAAEAPEVPVAPKALEEATAKVFDETETHADQPPHGGKIVPLGAHVAHAEVVLVPDTGELTLYVLDAGGQAGQRIAQPVVLVDVETSGRSVRLELAACGLEGERAGDASCFTGKSDDLLRMAEGKATLRWIGVSGQVFSDVVVSWP